MNGLSPISQDSGCPTSVGESDHYPRQWAGHDERFLLGLVVTPPLSTRVGKGSIIGSMATITCTDCGGTVSAKAGSCPHCGAPGKGGRWGTPRQAMLLVVLLLVLAAVSAYAIYWQFIYKPTF